MQPWHRWREPLALVLLVALALMLVVRAVSLGLAVAAGNTGGLFGAIPGGDDLLLLAAAAAVLWCATAAADGRGTGGRASGTESACVADRRGRAGGRRSDGARLAGAGRLERGDDRRLAPARRGFVLFVVEGLLRLAVPVAALVAVVLAVRRVPRRAGPDDRPAGADRRRGGRGSDAPAVTAAPGAAARRLAGRRGDRCGLADRRRRGPGAARVCRGRIRRRAARRRRRAGPGRRAVPGRTADRRPRSSRCRHPAAAGSDGAADDDRPAAAASAPRTYDSRTKRPALIAWRSR